MEAKIINDIQNRILALVPKKDVALLEDSCSEVSRLVAAWLIDDNLNYKYSIFKGDNVFNGNKPHDLLVLENEEEVIVLDPTVWQFKPEAETILVAKTSSKNIALEKIKSIYGGAWSFSEEITKVSGIEKQNYLEIISQNIKET